MTVNELAAIFLEETRQNRAAATFRSYRTHVNKFVSTFGDRQLSEIKPLELRAWLNDSRIRTNGKAYAPDTIRCQVICIEAFQSFAIENGELAAKITKLEKPQTRQRDRLPTPEEISLIFQHAKPDFSLIYRALRLTGARPSELCNANIEQIDHSAGYRRIVITEHKTARVTGKPKIIPIGEKLSHIVDQSISDRTAGPVFIRSNGKPWTSDSLGRTFRQIRKAANLADDLVVYLARHEVATKLCQKVGIAAARDALGHTNIKTTSRYVKQDEAAILRNQDLLGDA